MLVLGIETSCDETSVAVVKNGRAVLSNVISTSLRFHAKYGGVIPEIASRKQLETIVQVADEALKKARTPLDSIGLICVTCKPGLLGSLLVGLSFAKSISLTRSIPLLGIDHVHSHMYANFLNGSLIRLPCMALVVSGGHTCLYHVKSFDRLELIGQTVDDACGEAFDKVAKILGLGYPGGPVIEQYAKKGDSSAFDFRCCNTKRPYDFSFSGIKTAVLYAVRGINTADTKKKLTARLCADIAASFQESVCTALTQKTLSACADARVKRLVIGGGVAMNNRLREHFLAACKTRGVACYFPPKEYCTDNAAMIAGFGYQLFKKGHCSSLALNAG
jgi:N6-L-threonylcarbamoyladenine synthase